MSKDNVENETQTIMDITEQIKALEEQIAAKQMSYGRPSIKRPAANSTQIAGSQGMEMAISGQGMGKAESIESGGIGVLKIVEDHIKENSDIEKTFGSLK